MPSFDHEILVALFRARPELACELLARCAGIELTGRVEDGSVDLSQVASPEYRADRVVVLRDDAGRASAAIVVEIQRWFDTRKRWSWPVYVGSLRAIHRCPVHLLVIAPIAAVAQWARRPIELGHPGFCLRPIVVGFRDVPRITDLDAARAAPELAVLSTMAHPDAEVARAAVAAIRPLARDEARLYFDVILSALPAAVRQALEADMKGYEYRSDFARNYVAQGREEGREEGRGDVVVALAREKLGVLTADDEVALRRLGGESELTRVLVELARAPDAAAARAIVDRLSRDE